MAAKKVAYQGETFRSIAALAQHLGVSVYVLRDRIRQGWPEDKWGEPQRLKQHTNETLDRLIRERKLRVERVGNIVDTKTPMEFRCLVHDQVHPAAASNVLQGHGLLCCYQEHVSNQGREKREASADRYDVELAKSNPSVIRLEAYRGRGTPVWHLCTVHWEWRRARPGDVLNGHGLKCCLIASNAKRVHAKRDMAGKEYLRYLESYEDGNFSLIGEYRGRDYPVDHHCRRHNRVLPVRPNGLLGGQRMLCCGEEAWALEAKKRMSEAAADFVSRLAEANPDVELVGEYLGTNVKTLFRCKKHGEEHLAAPKQRLRGQGLHCCHVANGQAMGRLTGPLNGWSGDSVWQVLAGRSTRHDPAILYLFDSPDTPLLKYGITSDGIEKRKSRSWLPGIKAIRYGELLIDPRHYPDRDQAVLVEGAYQFSYGCDASRELGIGWTELTDASPELFIERIHELEQALNEMGAWDFADEYCDPLQVEKAQALVNDFDKS